MFELNLEIRPECEWTVKTAEDAMMESLFEDGGSISTSATVGSKRPAPSEWEDASSISDMNDIDDRPCTPPEARRMRSIIDAEAGEGAPSSAIPVETKEAGPSNTSVKKHSLAGYGALREHGGITGFMSKAEGKKRALVQ